MAGEQKKRWRTGRNGIYVLLLTGLCVVCFPVNPLVLTGVLSPGYNRAAHVAAWVVWAFGMVLVMAPIVMFPRRGGVQKGQSFVHTTRLVETGAYGLVRHPQYLGGILAIFVTTLLENPHWLFAVLGVLGAAVIYIGCIEEEQRLVQKFGDDYVSYMQRVPRMNILVGVIRCLRK